MFHLRDEWATETIGQPVGHNLLLPMTLSVRQPTKMLVASVRHQHNRTPNQTETEEVLSIGHFLLPFLLQSRLADVEMMS